MIIRNTGKKRAGSQEIYRVIVPIEYSKPIIFTGVAFFEVDNITNLQLTTKLDAVVI